ncbi:uncharacterized protein RJT21DRAFT_139128 [Scheffersomyces amazonensis]|uniref:uncharacterized protein n=1 Tax=Scheffersomyces amazonensis TaxID=1078765 RepID=UPI00315C4E80
MSSIYQKHTKADLLSVLNKLEIKTASKSTKKILIEKLDGYITDHPEDGLLTVQSLLEEIDDANEEDDDDETTLHEEIIESSTTGGAEEDLGDKDYDAPAPLDLKQWIIDPIIEQYEVIIQKIYEFTDNVGITYVDYTDELREQLSKSVSLNYLEIIIEFSYFIYTFLPFVELKENALNHDLLKDNIPFFASSTIPTPEITALFECSIISTFLSWVIFSIILPLIASYFVNFSRRVLVFDDSEGIVARIYDYDPFVFALSKVVIFYLIGRNASSVFNFGINWDFFTYHLSPYERFSHSLGTFPVVIGATNVLLALYSQFEEY